MQRSTEVESVPEASRPIRLANGINLTIDEKRHGEGKIKTNICIRRTSKLNVGVNMVQIMLRRNVVSGKTNK